MNINGPARRKPHMSAVHTRVTFLFEWADAERGSIAFCSKCAFRAGKKPRIALDTRNSDETKAWLHNAVQFHGNRLSKKKC